MKQWIKEYFTQNQNIGAFSVAVLSALTLFLVLFSSPRPGCVDVGEYDQTLFRLGLTRTAEDLAHPEERYFSGVIEKFDILGIDSARYFSNPSESLIFPAAVISSICDLFGIPFSTVYLALLFSLVVVISVYIITKSLHHYIGDIAVAAGCILCVCMLSSDNIVYFNSLYNNGMVTVSFLFMAAMMLRGLAEPAGRGLKNILPIPVAMYLFLTSAASMIGLIFLLLPFLGYLIYKNRPEKAKAMVYYVVSGAMSAVLLLFCIQFMQKSEQLNSRMNIYTATFNGAFETADNQEEAVGYFGLSSEYVQDIGKSYYLDQAQYVVAPYSEEAEELLYSKLSYGKLLKYYISHPDSFLKLADHALQNATRVNRDKFKYIQKDNENVKETVERMGYYPIVRKLIMPVDSGHYLGMTVTVMLLLLGIIGYRKWRKQRAEMFYILLSLELCSIGSLFLNVFLYGNFDINMHLFGHIIITDGMFVAVSIVFLYEICKLSRFLNREETEAAESVNAEAVHLGKVLLLPLKKVKDIFTRYISSSARNTTIFMSILAVIIMTCVFFLPERIGAYNNGDFGRMIDAMGINYTEYDLIHQDEQTVTKVIETYDWREDFDWSTVTFLSPSMSQTMLAVLVRLTGGAMGFPYSTVYATVIYMFMMGAAFGAFVWGGYKLWGKKVIILALVLLPILFGSYNMGWFNSLFSEATEMAGLLMVLGTSMAIIAKERGTVSVKLWLAFLFGIRFFIGGKAQVTVEILLLAPWAMLLAIYHRPPKKIKWIIQIALVGIITVMTARSALIIYQKNNEISSGDTTYASIFAGVLVVADDPVAALDELGLDASLIADAGKHQYLPKDQYYCAPRTEMAEEMVYSKIDAIGVLKWYLKHPKELWRVLDYTATQAAETMPGFFLYSGEKTTEVHRTVSKFNYWEIVRGNLTPNVFWQYILLYSVFIGYCGKKAFSKKEKNTVRLLSVFFILLILVGAEQFPLTVIGNGFVDNVKQLFVFRMVHDIIIVCAVFYCCLHVKGAGKNEQQHND